MADIREEEQELRERLTELYGREDKLTAEEYEEMQWIEGILQDIELRELDTRRM